MRLDIGGGIVKPLRGMLNKLKAVKLDKGAHDSPETGVCFLEAAAWITGQPFSDHPACVSPVIGAFGRSWNDTLNDEDRQMLKPYVVKILDTKTTAADEETRAWLATDWLAREFAPAWLRLAGLTEHAETLEKLAPLVSAVMARKAQPALDAARDAAYGAARDAAYGAARDAAYGAARDAAYGAAYGAAYDAAYGAARDAAYGAAYDAAYGAARDAALDAAYDAARDAAYERLAPTVKILQKSALRLLDRMIEVGRAEAA